jgi:hypothetical protein
MSQPTSLLQGVEMVPIISLLFVVGSSLIVTRVAAVALEQTGLSSDSARFQALSAFTGVGFTTGEAEHVVTDPVRRRIVMSLMLIGNVGIVSGMAALLLSAADLRTDQEAGVLLATLVGGLLLLCWIGSSRWMDDRMCSLIRWAIQRWTTLDARDYTRLLHIGDEYSVSRHRVEEDDWIAGKTLGAAGLKGEGLLVLGIECPGGNFIGAPPEDVEVRLGDEIVVYGLATRIAELDSRVKGDEGIQAHVAATSSREERVREERSRAGR